MNELGFDIFNKINETIPLNGEIKSYRNAHQDFISQSSASFLNEQYRVLKFKTVLPEDFIHFKPKVEKTTIPSTVTSKSKITFLNNSVSKLNLCPQIQLSNFSTTLKNNLTHLAPHFIQEAVCLNIPKDYQGEINIESTIFDIQTNHDLLVINVEENAKINIIQEDLESTLRLLSIKSLIINVQNNSEVTLVTLEKNNPHSHHVYSLEVNLFENAKIYHYLLIGSFLKSKYNITFNLHKTGASSALYPLIYLDKQNILDYSSLTNHFSGETYSTQLSKAHINNEGKGSFTGKIFIHPQSQKVEAAQLNKVILNDSKSHFLSHPQLEIFADDVKCTHGSTTGQVSMDEVFYLQSRGISENKAKELISSGFLNEIALKISDLTLRDHFLKSLQMRIQK